MCVLILNHRLTKKKLFASFTSDQIDSNIAMVIESVCVNYIPNILLPHTMSKASRNAHLLIKRVQFPLY